MNVLELQQELLKAVNADTELEDNEKDELENYLRQQDNINKMIAGALGTGIAVLLGQYLKLSSTSKILLSLAGYGIGNIIYKSWKKKRRYMNFDDKTRTYELDDSN